MKEAEMIDFIRGLGQKSRGGRWVCEECDNPEVRENLIECPCGCKMLLCLKCFYFMAGLFMPTDKLQ